MDSKGPVIYKQERVTQYNRPFKIWKFRTMVTDADKKGSLVTSANDSRITKVGNFIRRVRLDELPQLVNVLKGEMSFVGTRPEVPRYTEQYSPEMMATLDVYKRQVSKESELFKPLIKRSACRQNLMKSTKNTWSMPTVL